MAAYAVGIRLTSVFVFCSLHASVVGIELNS